MTDNRHQTIMRKCFSLVIRQYGRTMLSVIQKNIIIIKNSGLQLDLDFLKLKKKMSTLRLQLSTIQSSQISRHSLTTPSGYKSKRGSHRHGQKLNWHMPIFCSSQHSIHVKKTISKLYILYIIQEAIGTSYQHNIHHKNDPFSERVKYRK